MRATFGRALSHLEGLEKALGELALSKDPAAAPSLEKILRRMGDALEAMRGLEPGDRRLLAKLQEKKLGQVSFNADTGEYRGVVEFLKNVTAIPIELTPQAERAIAERHLVLELTTDRPMSVEGFLDLMTDRSKVLTWAISKGKVTITTREAAAAVAAMPRATTAKDEAVLAILRAIRPKSSFARASLAEWTAFYGGLTGAAFEVDSAVRDLPPDSTTLVDFKLPEMTAERALDEVTLALGLDWRIENEAVRIVLRDEAGAIAASIRYHQQRIRALRARLAAEQNEKK